MDIRYIAGNFDADGSICLIHRRSRNGQVLSSVVAQSGCTNLPLLQAFQKRFGGRIDSIKRQKSHHSPAWIWRLWSKQACEFLKEVYPYLILKQERAELAFEFQALIDENKKRHFRTREGRFRKITKEEWNKRMRLREKVMQLNQRKGGRRARSPDKF